MNTTSKHRRELCPMAPKTQANGLSPAYLMVALVLCNSCGAPPPAAARKAIVQTDATLEAPADRETGDSTSEDSGRATDPTPSQTPWPTPTPSTYPEPSPTRTPSVSPTPTPTPTPTPVPTQTPTPTPPPPSLNLGSKFPAQRDESLIATCSADFSGMAEIGGTEVDDVLDGTASSERVVGRGGNDTVRGNDGDDFVSGNIGNDQVNGNMGADQVRGGQGDDVVMGGAGNDCVYGDLGNDQVIGGGGNDSLQGGDGSDVLWPRSQTRDPALDCTDPTFASCTVDWLAGEEGDDTYMVGDGDGRVVILPDTMGTNTLRCTSASAIAKSDEGSDRYLLGSGFVIRIVGYHSGLSRITLQDCD